MNDITIIYLTASLIPEQFAQYQRKVLLEAIGDTPLISVSRKPIDFGVNLVDTEKRSLSNIYYQMLRAAKLAKTDFIAVAEDDALYPREHFKKYRPTKDTFAYNKNRLLLFTWGEPMYSWKDRISNATLIAPRELAIEALEERFKRYPNGIPDKIVGELGKPMVDRNLRVSPRKIDYFFTDVSVVHFNHDFASEEWQRKHVKKPGSLRSYDIPHWGRADKLVTNFK